MQPIIDGGIESRGAAWLGQLADRLREGLATSFGIDRRSLALFRIGLGSILLADLARRLPHLQDHYSDLGVMPRIGWLEQLSTPVDWSFHLFSGGAAGQLVLFAVAAVFALLLVVGWRTRLATFASWLLLVSLHHRNYMVLNGGDVLLRCLLFWSMFLPLGERFSVDAARAGVRPRPFSRIATMASAALLLQVCFVYWFTAILKNHPIWNREGSAIFYALNIDQFATPLAPLLIEHVGLLRFMTRSVWALEAFGPWLALSPVISAPLRSIAVFCFVSLHAGIGLCMNIGLFPLICVVAWLPFLPGAVWYRVGGLGASATVQRVGDLARRLAAVAREVQSALAAPAAAARRGLVSASVGLLLVYVFLWNVATVSPRREGEAGREASAVLGRVLGLDQRWTMFAPVPLTLDGWWVVPARLADGRDIDVLRDGADVTWDKPASVTSMYPTDRWRKYMMNLVDPDQAVNRPYFADYLCRRWNRQHRGADRLESLKLVFMTETTLPRHRVGPPRPWMVAEHACDPDARPAKEEVVTAHAEPTSSP